MASSILVAERLSPGVFIPGEGPCGEGPCEARAAAARPAAHVCAGRNLGGERGVSLENGAVSSLRRSKTKLFILSYSRVAIFPQLKFVIML